MKIIFLDFDGVMNSDQSVELHYHRWLEDGSPKGDIAFNGKNNTWCPLAISNLEIILRKMPKIGIVISSSWRKNTPIQDLRSLFENHPIIARAMVDKTPVVNGKQRGYEIKQWIKYTEMTIDEFVILDDNRDMHGVMKHLVQTDPYHGFMRRDAEKALAILGYVEVKEKMAIDLTAEEIAFRYGWCDE